MKEILIADKIKKDLASKTSFHDVLKSRYGKEALKPIGSFVGNNNHSAIPKKEK